MKCLKRLCTCSSDKTFSAVGNRTELRTAGWWHSEGLWAQWRSKVRTLTLLWQSHWQNWALIRMSCSSVLRANLKKKNDANYISLLKVWILFRICQKYFEMVTALLQLAAIRTCRLHGQTHLAECYIHVCASGLTLTRWMCIIITCSRGDHLYITPIYAVWTAKTRQLDTKEGVESLSSVYY